MTTGTRQLWALGDYDRIAALVADMGRDLVAAAGVRPGDRVLDVAAGTGNAALPAAAAVADVTAADITPELIAVGERAARERGLAVRWEVADAQALPFADGAFDVVLSAIGAMFPPDHAATARELLRVCRPGGTVAMANWTPDGGVGQFFALLDRYGSPAQGSRATAWGDPAHVAGLLGADGLATDVRTVRLAFTGPPGELCAYYQRYFAPAIAARDGLDQERAALLDRELLDMFTAEDSRPSDGPWCYDLEYLLVISRRPAAAQGS